MNKNKGARGNERIISDPALFQKKANLESVGHRSEFVYDGLGRRVVMTEKDDDAVTSDKKYLWDGVDIAEEVGTDGTTSLRQFYTQGFIDNDGTKLFYTRDHLGSVRELTDNTQTVRTRYDYDPYGRMTKVSGDRDSVFGYTNHFWHEPSGLNLAMYRAYDPNLGRWISRDPYMEKVDLNLYRYCYSKPIDMIDRTGAAADGFIDWVISKLFPSKVAPPNPTPSGTPETNPSYPYPNKYPGDKNASCIWACKEAFPRNDVALKGCILCCQRQNPDCGEPPGIPAGKDCRSYWPNMPIKPGDTL